MIHTVTSGLGTDPLFIHFLHGQTSWTCCSLLALLGSAEQLIRATLSLLNIPWAMCINLHQVYLLSGLLLSCRVLRDDKAKLQLEMEKVTKVATLVGSRLARLVMDARRSTTGNTQLVEELKRYNRRLEVAAHSHMASMQAVNQIR